MHRLVLLRHGESTWNLDNRFTGWTDVDLTPRGALQAQAAGRLLPTERLTCQAQLPAGDATGRVPEATKLPHIHYG